MWQSRRRLLDDPIIISDKSNAPVMKVLREHGALADDKYFYHAEAQKKVYAKNSNDSEPAAAWFANNTEIEYFDEFQWFTGVVYWGNGMSQRGFYGCTNLKSIKLPQSLKQIGNWYAYQKGPFNGTKIEYLKIPDNVTQLTTDPFQGMSKLKTLVWGKNLSFPGNSCYYSYGGFNGDWELENIVNLPDTPSGVGTGLNRGWNSCFNNCRKLNIIDYPIIFKPEVLSANYLQNTPVRQGTITFPYATAIYQHVFSYDNQVCVDYNLQQGFIVNLPNVKALRHGYNAGASLIIVGDTCETVEDYGLQDCRDFRFLSTTPPTKATTRSNYDTARVFVPESALETYRTAANWSNMANRIKAYKEQPAGYFCNLSTNINVPSDYTIVSYITNGETAKNCTISSLGYTPKRYSQILLDWEQTAVRDGNASTRRIFYSTNDEFTVRIESGQYNYNPLVYRPGNTNSSLPNYNVVLGRSLLFNDYVTGEPFESRSILKLGNKFVEYHGKSWQWDEAEYDYSNPIALFSEMTDRSYKVYRLCIYEPQSNCNNFDDSSQYEIVRDYIPVKRNADDVYGLYERLTDTFYPSTRAASPFSGPTT